MNSKIFKVQNGELKSIWVAITDELKESIISKSSEGDSNHFELQLTTWYNSGTYNTYAFSLNEMEAKFDIESDELMKIILLDTTVHKKIEFTGNKAVLIYSRGQDVVGQHSELNTTTTKEFIKDIVVNGVKLEAPYDIKAVYEILTNKSVEEDDSEEEQASAKFWYDFIIQEEQK